MIPMLKAELDAYNGIVNFMKDQIQASKNSPCAKGVFAQMLLFVEEVYATEYEMHQCEICGWSDSKPREQDGNVCGRCMHELAADFSRFDSDDRDSHLLE